MKESADNRIVKIVYCYHQEDQEFCDRIETQLQASQWSRLINTWRYCSPGEEPKKVTEEQLNSADIILLLVSSNFMADDFCKSMRQMALARKELDQHVQILPIILRPVEWKSSLGHFLALPSDARPVTQWLNIDEATHNIALGIGKVVERVLEEQISTVVKPPLIRPSVSRRTLIIGFLGIGFLGVSGLALKQFLFSTPSVLTYTNHADSVWCVAWSPDGRYIASASVDKTVQIWDATSGQHILTYTRHMGKVWTAAWSPDGKRIASAGDDDFVKIWDALTGSNTFTYNGHHSGVISYGGIFCVAWSPDGKQIVSSSVDFFKKVQVWDAISSPGITIGSNPIYYEGFQQNSGPRTESARWSPDGKRVAISCDDNTVRVWDIGASVTTFIYAKHTNTVMAAEWSLEGRRIASASLDKTVQIWDASNGKQLFTYTGHMDGVMCLAWSPDGQQIASAGLDRTVQIWNASDGKQIFTYTGHTDTVRSVRWSPDGKRVASGSQDKTVQIWNTPL